MAAKRQTQSFKFFTTNVNRSRAFLRIFKKDRKPRQPSNDEKELLRGCLVFAVGALDAYLSDVILEIVPTYGSKSEHMKRALKEIAKSDPGLALRVSIAGTAPERQAEFRKALAGWLDGKSFQGVEKVSNALSYLGCTLLLSDIEMASNKDTASELERITGERHKIVHNGSKPNMTYEAAEDAVELVERIATAVDKEVHTLHLAR